MVGKLTDGIHLSIFGFPFYFGSIFLTILKVKCKLNVQGEVLEIRKKYTYVCWENRIEKRKKIQEGDAIN